MAAETARSCAAHTLCPLVLALLLASCASLKVNTAQWQRNECGKVIDFEDRNRCLRRVEAANLRDAPP